MKKRKLEKTKVNLEQLKKGQFLELDSGEITIAREDGNGSLS